MIKVMVGKNLIGQKFGRLLVIRQIGIDTKTRQKKWLCECDCGNKKETITSYLTSGDTTSCGCYRRECELKNLKEARNREVNKKHGMHNTRIYQIWADMKARCNNPKHNSFENYGGRGIKVCEEWKKDFIIFYKWAINNGYSDDLTIDRINVNGNYEPNNCRWANWKEQANNKRTTRKITIYGETKTAYEFEKQYGIKAHLLINRYDKGYSDYRLIYKGNLGHFRKTNLKRDNKGRFMKKEKIYEIQRIKRAL